jgi:hypothetical protein
VFAVVWLMYRLLQTIFNNEPCSSILLASTALENKATLTTTWYNKCFNWVLWCSHAPRLPILHGLAIPLDPSEIVSTLFRLVTFNSLWVASSPSEPVGKTNIDESSNRFSLAACYFPQPQFAFAICFQFLRTYVPSRLERHLSSRKLLSGPQRRLRARSRRSEVRQPFANRIFERWWSCRVM